MELGKDIDIQYIHGEENQADIMNKNTSEADFARHMRRITELELCHILYTGRGNVKMIGVADDVIIP